MSLKQAMPFRERLRGVLTFVAIVWGVAGSFVLFELVALRGFETLRGSSLALPQAVQRSTVCTSPGIDPRAAPPERADVPGATLATVWMLGVYAGTDARVSQWLTPIGRENGTSNAQQPFLAQARALHEMVGRQLDRDARLLKVPAPGAFAPGDIANAIVEYGPFVEGEGNTTARAVASAYGARACEMYKLGAYWGFGAMTVNAGIAYPFDAEMTYYAQRLRIPDALWQPMAAAGREGAQPAIDTDALTNGIASYVGGTR